jgi:hypothetical protein
VYCCNIVIYLFVCAVRCNANAIRQQHAPFNIILQPLDLAEPDVIMRVTDDDDSAGARLRDDVYALGNNLTSHPSRPLQFVGHTDRHGIIRAYPPLIPPGFKFRPFPPRPPPSRV